MKKISASKLAFALILTLGLVGCNRVADYRTLDTNPVEVQPTATETVEVQPTEAIPDPVAKQDYSKYKDSTELQTINYTPMNTEPKSKAGDSVSVHYSGFLTDGTLFDSSIPRGEPFTLVLGQNTVIAGWEEGLLGRSVGDKFTLVIPADKAYGEAGRPSIPPNSTLVFEIEIIDIEPAA